MEILPWAVLCVGIADAGQPDPSLPAQGPTITQALELAVAGGSLIGLTFAYVNQRFAGLQL